MESGKILSADQPSLESLPQEVQAAEIVKNLSFEAYFTLAMTSKYYQQLLAKEMILSAWVHARIASNPTLREGESYANYAKHLREYLDKRRYGWSSLGNRRIALLIKSIQNGFEILAADLVEEILATYKDDRKNRYQALSEDLGLIDNENGSIQVAKYLIRNIPQENVKIHRLIKKIISNNEEDIKNKLMIEFAKFSFSSDANPVRFPLDTEIFINKEWLTKNVEENLRVMLFGERPLGMPLGELLGEALKTCSIAFKDNQLILDLIIAENQTNYIEIALLRLLKKAERYKSHDWFFYAHGIKLLLGKLSDAQRERFVNIFFNTFINPNNHDLSSDQIAQIFLLSQPVYWNLAGEKDIFSTVYIAAQTFSPESKEIKIICNKLLSLINDQISEEERRDRFGRFSIVLALVAAENNMVIIDMFLSGIVDENVRLAVCVEILTIMLNLSFTDDAIKNFSRHIMSRYNYQAVFEGVLLRVSVRAETNIFFMASTTTEKLLNELSAESSSALSELGVGYWIMPDKFKRLMRLSGQESLKESFYDLLRDKFKVVLKEKPSIASFYIDSEMYDYDFHYRESVHQAISDKIKTPHEVSEFFFLIKDNYLQLMFFVISEYNLAKNNIAAHKMIKELFNVFSVMPTYCQKILRDAINYDAENNTNVFYTICGTHYDNEKLQLDWNENLCELLYSVADASKEQQLVLKAISSADKDVLMSSLLKKLDKDPNRWKDSYLIFLNRVISLFDQFSKNNELKNNYKDTFASILISYFKSSKKRINKYWLDIAVRVLNIKNFSQMIFQQADDVFFGWTEGDYRGFNFNSANIANGVLCDLDFSHGTFYGTYCAEALFANSNLSYTFFGGAQLNNANWIGVNLDYIDVKDAKYLNTVTFLSENELQVLPLLQERLSRIAENHDSENFKKISRAVLMNIMRFTDKQIEQNNYQHALSVLELALHHPLFSRHKTELGEAASKAINNVVSIAAQIGTFFGAAKPALVSPTTRQKIIIAKINTIKEKLLEAASRPRANQ